MELYTSTCYELSERLTKRYSTSFSMSSRLFSAEICHHIYAIYGLVRIADEIVDTYRQHDAAMQLKNLHSETVTAIKNHYSTNPIVHSFAVTAEKYGISDDLLAPFFESMQTDLQPQKMTPKLYRSYIYGSAEVVGLMCLKVFVGGNDNEYAALSAGAQSLGAAYQKVNFLRDIAADYNDLGRTYFPNLDYAAFNDERKAEIIADIRQDFTAAKPAIDALPLNARPAVKASYAYYQALLNKVSVTPASQLLRQRVRISNAQKIVLLAKAYAGL